MSTIVNVSMDEDARSKLFAKLPLLEEYFGRHMTLEDLQGLTLEQMMAMVKPRHRRYVFTLATRLRFNVPNYLSLASGTRTSVQELLPVVNPTVLAAATVVDLRESCVDQQGLLQLAAGLSSMPHVKYVRLERNRLLATLDATAALMAVLNATTAVVAIPDNLLASTDAKKALFHRLSRSTLLRLVWISHARLSRRDWHALLDTRSDNDDDLRREVMAVHEDYYARAERWDAAFEL